MGAFSLRHGFPLAERSLDPQPVALCVAGHEEGVEGSEGFQPRGLALLPQRDSDPAMEGLGLRAVGDAVEDGAEPAQLQGPVVGLGFLQLGAAELRCLLWTPRA